MNPPAILASLRWQAALGSRGEVGKRREVWHWFNVRIHLDEVEGLGSFVEFEAVLGEDAGVVPSRQRLHQLGQALEQRLRG
jgi:adenylate cyclase class IV